MTPRFRHRTFASSAATLLVSTASLLGSTEVFAQQANTLPNTPLSATLSRITVPPGFIVQPSDVLVFPPDLSDLQTNFKGISTPPLDVASAYRMKPEKYSKYTSLLQSLINKADSKGFTWIGDEGFSVKAIQKLHDRIVLDPFSFALGGRPTYKVASATGFFNNLNKHELYWYGSHEIWPNGDVPYFFDGISSQNQQRFQLAYKEWEAVAHVKFTLNAAGIANTTQSYLRVTNVQVANGVGGTSAAIGRISLYNSSSNPPNPGQDMKITITQDQTGLSDWDRPGVIEHELGHSLGFLHEHQRNDRNTYVTINDANVQSGSGYGNNPDAIRQFDRLPDWFLDPTNPIVFQNWWTAYDFRSIMGYRNDALIKPNLADPYATTIDPQPAYYLQSGAMGQRVGPSYFDKLGLSEVYGPPLGFLDLATRASDSNTGLLLSNDVTTGSTTTPFVTSVANRNASLGTLTPTNLGSETDWRPKKICYGSDGALWLMRNNKNGSVSIQKRNGTTVLSNVTYSNPDKAQFVDFAVAPDGGIRLLQLNRDGNWKLWDGDPANNKYYSPTYVPGNFAKAIAIRPDNLVCVMIESIQGNSGFGCKAWTLSAPTGVAGGGGFTLLGVTSTIAATGTPLDIAFDSSGNIHILWSTQSYGGAYYSSSIQFSTWKATDGSPTYTGLVTSVSGADRPVSFTVAPDGRIRVLWNNYASKYYFVDKYLFSGAPNYSYTYENEALAYY